MKVLSKDDAFNLSDLIKDGDWMVLYYAEWCGHCQNMKPEWAKVISKIKQSNKKINIADVKSDFIEDLKHKPQIEGFPTIKMYNNGKEVAKFQDDRVADKMEKFALSNSNSKSSHKASNNKPSVPPVHPVHPVHNIEDLIEKKVTQKLENKLENKIEELQAETAEIKEELPTIEIANTHSTKKSIVTSHKPTHIPSHKPTHHSVKSHHSNKLVPNHRLSNLLKQTSKRTTVKKSIKPVVKPKPIVKPAAKQVKPANKPVQQPAQPLQAQTLQQVLKDNLPCNEVRKAKLCSAVPKCMFDYTANKCKSKSTNDVSRKSKPVVKKNKTMKTVKQSKKLNKNNNIRQSTKEVFGELIKSFSRIGNEAKKDSRLLSSVSKKL